MRIALLPLSLVVVTSVAQVLPDQLTDAFKESVSGLLDCALEEGKDVLKSLGIKPLPESAYDSPYKHKTVPLADAKAKLEEYLKCNDTGPFINDHAGHTKGSAHAAKRQNVERCANPRVRIEWDRATDDQRQQFIDGIKCLMAKPPSGQWPNAKSRYEDLSALHQWATPFVHTNDKFGLYHRTLVLLMEKMMRDECGFTGPMIWWNEAAWPGRWSRSSVFSSQWFGSIGIGGRCVTDGQFGNIVCNVGPGGDNYPHCVQRKGDPALTAQCTEEYNTLCRRYPDYALTDQCIFGGPHSIAHNAVGPTMSDVQASVCDPIFWIHHLYVDRLIRVATNARPEWLTSIDGKDYYGNDITMDTIISTRGMMPDIRVRDVINTLSEKLCYKYDF